MKTRYICYYVILYDLPEEIRTVESLYGIADFKDGFWVNKNYNLTRGSDAKYWIPPSAIMYVEKLDE